MKARVLPRPIIKWAGGKSRMLQHFASIVPDKINRYFEPFFGGGAFFFDLVCQKRFKSAILGDMNPELMNTYRVVQNSVEDLIRELQTGSYVYSRETFKLIRSWPTEQLSEVVRAARFIYLNRTCFNGLYRVNRKGIFNTPFGKYTDPVICDSEALRAASTAFAKARLVEKDFSTTLRQAKQGDFVYLDPPYYPVSETAKFTSYTNDGFGIEQHTRLAIKFAELADRGVTVILSNSWCDTTKRLYRDYEMIELTGARSIGGPLDSRKSVREMMVVANRPRDVIQNAPCGAGNSSRILERVPGF